MGHRDITRGSTALLAALTFTAVGAGAAMPLEYQEARQVFQQAEKSAGYFDDAYGYALFPTIGKGAIGIGGAHGSGRVYVSGDHVGNTSMSQVSVGFQFGGQAYTQKFSYTPVD